MATCCCMSPDTGYRLQVMLCHLTSQAGACTEVALKQPLDEHSPEDAIIDTSPSEVHKHQLAKEGRKHKLMLHPHIVEYRGTIDHQGTIGLLLEYCPLSPRRVLQNCSVRHLLNFMVHALRAMQHVHAQGYIHMDLKLDNFVACLCEHNSVAYKLTDFGLSVRNGASASHPSGTWSHMATELFTSSEDTPATVTAAADVYSFAVMVIDVLARMPIHKVLMTGELSDVHKDYGLLSVFDYLNQEDHVVPAERWDKVPWLKQQLQQCLDRDPSGRPEVAVLLETVQTELRDLTPDQDHILMGAVPAEAASADSPTGALPEAPAEVPEVVPATTPAVRAALPLHYMHPVRVRLSLCAAWDSCACVCRQHRSGSAARHPRPPQVTVRAPLQPLSSLPGYKTATRYLALAIQSQIRRLMHCL